MDGKNRRQGAEYGLHETLQKAVRVYASSISLQNSIVTYVLYT